MGLIFYGSSWQKPTTSGDYWLSFIFFKSLHIIEYGILFLLWRFALYSKSYSIKVAIAISIFYGITDEFHQTLVPTREGKIRDILIDALGVVIFWRFALNKAESFVAKNKFLKRIFLF